ncbi:unnamed protein product, partial [Porites evermanni]
DLVEWVAKQNYDVTFLMHYFGDSHTLGPPSSSVCHHNLDSPSCTLHSEPDSEAASLTLGTLLSDKCHFYFTQGLGPSTRRVYAFAQHRFLDFCTQDSSPSPLGSALPTNEDVLIRFCCHLADTLYYSSIKVYLSAIRSLHIEEGLPSSLVGCLQLQHVLREVSNAAKAQIIPSQSS